MALQIVAGGSGAGKSYKIYSELIQRSAEHPEQNFIVIVPEQFTMQTQKDLVRRHPNKGLLNVDVLSFNRLAYRVFGEVGGDRYPVLEETGKSLVVHKAILDASAGRELTVLKGTLEKSGAPDQMKSLISELMQYGVSPEQLTGWVEKSGPDSLLGRKLLDVQNIYRRFRDYLNEKYMTTEEMPEVLCRVIGKSAFVRGSTVVLDGFTGFTPMQHLVLAKLMKLCREVILIASIDPREDPAKKDGPHRLFHMSKVMIRKAVQIAGENGCEIRPVRWIDGKEKGRFCDAPALGFLEKNIFRYGRRVFNKEQQEIHLYEAANPAKEMRRIAEMIRNLIRREGLMYRDIAIVNGDMETYGKEAAAALDEAEIPYFLDQKRSVLRNPMVEFVRSALEMASRSYSYESVFRFLKSGMTDFTPEEIDVLENYVLAMGIRGRKQYESAWIRIPKGMRPAEMENINLLRQKFCEMTDDFAKGMSERNTTLRRKCEVLYALLTGQRIQQKGKEQQDIFEEQGNKALAGEYARIYPMLMALLDKMVEVLGNERMSLSAFRQLLETGLKETKIGLIPPGEDQVLVGDIERTRLKHIKVLFFAGVNDGWIPKPVSGNSVLSETDRSRLKEYDVELSPDAREEMYQQRFYLYLTLTKPSHGLYLSWSREDPSGEAMVPAYLIPMLRKMYTKLETETEDTYIRLETDEGIREILLEQLQKIDVIPADDVFRELVLDLAAREKKNREKGIIAERKEIAADIPHILEAAAARNPIEGIGKMMAQALYGKVLSNSATRLENFAACAFAHFAGYGLGLKERENYVFTMADMGTILHSALEKYSKKLEAEGLKWSAVSDEQSRRILGEAVQEVVHDYGNTILYSSERNKYLVKRITALMDRTIWALRTQIRQGKFEPAGAEIAFRADELDALNFTLKNGGQLKLRGKIDRVDICDEGDCRYLKVVDYKSGATQLDLPALYNGLQMQLVLYMNAVLESEKKKDPEKKVEPAGILYYNIKDPYVAPGDDETLKKEFLSALKPNGLVRSEMNVLQLLDETIESSGKSDVIPVQLKKDGGLSSYSTAADIESFETLSKFADHKALQLGERILNGETAASPYSDGEKKPCTYCPYKGLCGFDEKIPGYGYRKIKKEDSIDVLKKMKEELE